MTFLTEQITERHQINQMYLFFRNSFKKISTLFMDF